jgi:hypothetical protein
VCALSIVVRGEFGRAGWWALSNERTHFTVASEGRLGKGTVQSLTVTPTHTQRLVALAVAAPDGPVRLDSKRISSPHPALATLEAGSKVSLDFLLPGPRVTPSPRIAQWRRAI